MNEKTLLQHCHFYKGEAICPPQFDGKDAGKLWQAEKIICEDLPELVKNPNPRESMAQTVSDYVQKWSPFKFQEIMDTYFEKYPDLRSKLT